MKTQLLRKLRISASELMRVERTEYGCWRVSIPYRDKYGTQKEQIFIASDEVLFQLRIQVILELLKDVREFQAELSRQKELLRNEKEKKHKRIETIFGWYESKV